MRGKAPAIVLQSTSSGITPAYAGKRFEIGSGSAPS